MIQALQINWICTEKIPVIPTNLVFDSYIECDDGATFSKSESAQVDADGNIDKVVVPVKYISNDTQRQTCEIITNNDSSLTNVFLKSYFCNSKKI